MTPLSPEVPLRNAFFGNSLALDATHLVVGATGPDSGCVYVFERPSRRTWQEEAHLFPEPSADVQHFGLAVALQGGRLIAGKRHDRSTAQRAYAGGIYSFEQSANGTWVVGEPLEGPPPTGALPNRRFGQQLAFAGRQLLLAAPGESDVGADSPLEGAGAVYVMERADSGQWITSAQLTAAKPRENGGFGSRVAASSEVIAAATVRSNNAPEDEAGNVVVFERRGAQWERGPELVEPVPTYDSRFGSSIAVWGDTVVVGAIGPVDADLNGVGAAYVFERGPAGDYAAGQQLTPSGGAAGDRFGSQVAIWDDLIAVAANRHDGDGSPEQVDSGAVFVFQKRGSTWTETAILRPPAGHEYTYMGSAIALFEDTLVAGASSYSRTDGLEFTGIVFSADLSDL